MGVYYQQIKQRRAERTETQERAIRIREMLGMAEMLAMESKRLGRKATAHLNCPHCMGSGWVQMTAENDFGEMEDFFTLCRKCAEGSELAARITREA